MENLVVDKILDYCDVPQLFTARDAFDTLYMCLLYEDEPACCYSAIRISSKRLGNFLMGKMDLRALFLFPEKAGEYFEVVYQDNQYKLSALGTKKLPEEKLPAEGYFISPDERENIVINLPVKDHGLLKELVHKLGWVCM